MSKEFDKEYRELMSEDLPDLWDRIEENLSSKEKKVVKMTVATRKNIIGIAVAACVCLLIVGSGVHLFADSARFDDKKMAEISSETMNAYDASDMMSEEIVADEAFANEAFADEAVTDSAMAAATEGAAAEEISEEMKAEVSLSEEQDDLAETDMAETDGATEEMVTDKGVFYDATVKVVSIENSGEETIYYGEVISSDGELVTDHNLVMFCISEDAFEPFEIGLTYSLSLEGGNLLSSEIPIYIVHEVY